MEQAREDIAAGPKERPIIFSDAMVRAILDGRKTQTRRVVKLADDIFDSAEPMIDLLSRRRFWRFSASHDGATKCEDVFCPFGQSGNHLWVREGWAHNPFLAESECTGPADCFYRATCSEERHAATRWRPSMFMPRWASRITLELTDVRVERLRDISAKDALAEGVDEVCHCGEGLETHRLGNNEHNFIPMRSAVEEFAELWDSIHGDGSWNANPWVWALSFQLTAR